MLFLTHQAQHPWHSLATVGAPQETAHSPAMHPMGAHPCLGHLVPWLLQPPLLLAGISLFIYKQ